VGRLQDKEKNMDNIRSAYENLEKLTRNYEKHVKIMLSQKDDKSKIAYEEIVNSIQYLIKMKEKYIGENGGEIKPYFKEEEK